MSFLRTANREHRPRLFAAVGSALSFALTALATWGLYEADALRADITGWLSVAGVAVSTLLGDRLGAIVERLTVPAHRAGGITGVERE